MLCFICRRCARRSPAQMDCESHAFMTGELTGKKPAVNIASRHHLTHTYTRTSRTRQRQVGAQALAHFEAHLNLSVSMESCSVLPAESASVPAVSRLA